MPNHHRTKRSGQTLIIALLILGVLKLLLDWLVLLSRLLLLSLLMLHLP